MVEGCQQYPCREFVIILKSTITRSLVFAARSPVMLLLLSKQPWREVVKNKVVILDFHRA